MHDAQPWLQGVAGKLAIEPKVGQRSPDADGENAAAAEEASWCSGLSEARVVETLFSKLLGCARIRWARGPTAAFRLRHQGG
jgi:hypothetical protein